MLVVGVVMPKQHGCHVFPSNTKRTPKIPKRRPFVLGVTERC